MEKRLVQHLYMQSVHVCYPESTNCEFKINRVKSPSKMLTRALLIRHFRDLSKLSHFSECISDIAAYLQRLEIWNHGNPLSKNYSQCLSFPSKLLNYFSFTCPFVFSIPGTLVLPEGEVCLVIQTSHYVTRKYFWAWAATSASCIRIAYGRMSLPHWIHSTRRVLTTGHPRTEKKLGSLPHTVYRS